MVENVSYYRKSLTLGTGEINNFSAIAFSRFKLCQTAVGKNVQHRQIDVQLLFRTNAI